MFSVYDLLEFSKKIKEIRIDNKLSQKDVYDITGITENSLRKIENGYSMPRYETLEILSTVYKVDLIQILRYSRRDFNLVDLYNKFDNFIVHNNFDEIQELELLLSNKNESKIMYVDVHEFEYLKMLLKTANLYYNSNTSTKEIIQSIEEGFKLTIPNFSIDNFSKYKYNLLEIRGLILLGLVFHKDENILLSRKIYEFCLNYILNRAHQNNETQNLVIKLYFNMSYSYYKLEDDEKSLEFANKGIEYALNYEKIYLLSQLYFRKGVAKYFLEIEDYVDDFKYAILLFKMKKDEKSVELYKKIIKEKYNTDIEL